MKVAFAIIFALALTSTFADNKFCDSLNQWYDGKACQKCPDGCSECVNKGGKASCVKCDKDNAFLKFDADTGSCVACAENCATCKGPNAADCTKVNSGFTFNPSANKIIKCGKENCLYCGSDDKCAKCNFKFRLDADACVACSGEGCAECPAAVGTCTKCLWGYNMGSNNACFKCSNACISCTSDKVCTKCIDGFDLKDNACSLHQCETANCKTCADTKTCTACQDAFYLKDNKCTECPKNCNKCNTDGTCTECAAGYYVSSDKTSCTQCGAGCTTCKADATCDACNVGFFMNDDKKACTACTANCDVCTSTTTCTACQDKFTFNKKDSTKTECIAWSNCGKGKNMDDKTACTDGTIDNCLYGDTTSGNCFECAQGYYADGKNCVACSSGCDNCVKNKAGYVKCLTAPQSGIAIVENTNSKKDDTGYLCGANVATCDKKKVPTDCMPANSLASPQDKVAITCVGYDTCPHPVIPRIQVDCVLDKSAVKVALNVIAVVVAAFFAL